MKSSWRHSNVISATLESRSTCSCRTEILLEYHFQDYEDFWSHWLLDNGYRLTLDFDHLTDLLTFAFLFRLSSVYFRSKDIINVTLYVGSSLELLGSVGWGDHIDLNLKTVEFLNSNFCIVFFFIRYKTKAFWFFSYLVFENFHWDKFSTLNKQIV